MNGPQRRPKRSTTTMTGRWDIIEMDEFDEDYFDLGDQPPHLTITRSETENLRGDYAIGLSIGSLDGALREFGGETIFVFGYSGMDEMAPVESAGWVRLTEPDALEGEFLGGLGRFKARRQVGRSKRPARRRS